MSTDTDKPLPVPSEARPGTAGTEMLLTTTRRQASERFQAAARAERAYKARKRAAAARANLAEAKQHFREVGQHLCVGAKLVANVVRSAPYVLADGAERRRAAREDRRRLQAADKRRRLEEKLAREKESAEAAEREGELLRRKGKGPADEEEKAGDAGEGPSS